MMTTWCTKLDGFHADLIQIAVRVINSDERLRLRAGQQR
jgi:hypothetical protein